MRVNFDDLDSEWNVDCIDFNVMWWYFIILLSVPKNPKIVLEGRSVPLLHTAPFSNS